MIAPVALVVPVATTTSPASLIMAPPADEKALSALEENTEDLNVLMGLIDYEFDPKKDLETYQK